MIGERLNFSYFMNLDVPKLPYKQITYIVFDAAL